MLMKGGPEGRKNTEEAHKDGFQQLNVLCDAVVEKPAIQLYQQKDKEMKLLNQHSHIQHRPEQYDVCRRREHCYKYVYAERRGHANNA
jgi:hypothetical protein